MIIGDADKYKAITRPPPTATIRYQAQATRHQLHHFDKLSVCPMGYFIMSSKAESSGVRFRAESKPDEAAEASGTEEANAIRLKARIQTNPLDLLNDFSKDEVWEARTKSMPKADQPLYRSMGVGYLNLRPVSISTAGTTPA